MMIFEDVKKKLNANLDFLLVHFSIDIPAHLIYRLKIAIIHKTYLIDTGENPPVIKWHCSWDGDGDTNTDLFPYDKVYGNRKFRDIVKQGINVALKDANK